MRSERRSRCRAARAAAFAVVLAYAVCVAPPAAATWIFTDVSVAAGITLVHGYSDGASPPSFERSRAGGVAAGDFDRDGWIDLYVIAGEGGTNALYRNQHDGNFEEVAFDAGVALSGTFGSGPLFGDVDGDGWTDLFVGGFAGDGVWLFRNQGDGTFADVSATSGFATSTLSVWSGGFGDYDLDGDLDFSAAHWLIPGCPSSCPASKQLLWRNDGAGHFSDVTNSAIGAGIGASWRTFAPSFVDLDGDVWPELAIAADYGTTNYFWNDGDGTFTLADDAVLTDQWGMGSAIADYDHDGDLDWFISSIYQQNAPGRDGNRLYRNLGNGTFEDVTDAAGVRNGHWGWGACFADFDNDGDLDLFHVNGVDYAGAINQEYWNDPAVFFRNQGDGTFVEEAALRGLADTNDGRGIVCFDYDHDGDVDVFIANNRGPAKLYRNDDPPANAWLAVTPTLGPAAGDAVGASVRVTANGVTQRREILAGSNFESQNPNEAHFGLGSAATVDLLEIVWPNGLETQHPAPPVSTRVTIHLLFGDGFERGDSGWW